jgi:hypothetical protein
VDGLVFSTDASRLGYTAWRGSDRLMVVDGVEGPRYDRVWELAFSAEGGAFGYGAARGEDWLLAVNGEEREGAGGPVFSPVGSRMAYRIYHHGSWEVLADGTPGRSYDAVWNLVFSPDGRQVAYAAKRGTKVVPIVGGDEWGEYDRFRPGIVFAPNGSRAACIVRLGDKWAVLVDGVVGGAYDRVHQPAFDPTGEHIAYLAERDGQRMLVVDGIEAGTYNTDYPDPGELALRGQHELSFVAAREDSILLVTAEIVER